MSAEPEKRVKFPRAAVWRVGYISQPLPFGRCLHVGYGRWFFSMSLLTKTPFYPLLPQYDRRGFLIGRRHVG